MLTRADVQIDLLDPPDEDWMDENMEKNYASRLRDFFGNCTSDQGLFELFPFDAQQVLSSLLWRILAQI